MVTSPMLSDPGSYAGTPLTQCGFGWVTWLHLPSQFIAGEAEKIGPSKRNHGGVYPMKTQSGYRAEQTRLKIKKVVNMN
jgi:hypothetical protein